MPTIVWDKPEDRTYETGFDRGVLYLPDGSAVPWNGLLSVVEKADASSAPVYFDGMKIADQVSLGDFSATLKAVTYPDEFVELEGSADLRLGVFLKDQKPQVFGLCYRTSYGEGYKIHILYNVTAIPHDKTYASISDQPSVTEFEWDIVAVPEEVPGFRPTAHVVIDSREVDPLLLSDLEGMLYGTTVTDGSLMSMTDLVSFITGWYRIRIIDNGDGTWTAIFRDDIDALTWLDPPDDTIFKLSGSNAVFSIDGTEFTISDTTDITEVNGEIVIIDHGDGTWSATSDHDLLVPITTDGTFQILDANAIFLDSETYRVSNTPFGE